MAGFDWYVHGLWILGALFAFLGALLAGNLAWIEGTNIISFTLAVVLSFLLILVAGLFWISAAANAVQREFDPPASEKRKEQVAMHRAEIEQRKLAQEEAPRKNARQRHFMDRNTAHLKF